MFRRFGLLLVALVCAFSCMSSERVRVVTEYLEPYQIKLADGSLGGYMTEVVKAVFHLTGDSPDIEVMPWARAFSHCQVTKKCPDLLYCRDRREEASFLLDRAGAYRTDIYVGID